jgi:hypothetical protein
MSHDSFTNETLILSFMQKSIGVGYMAWKWIRISLDSWMVILMDMVQYCTVSYIPGAQGGSQFFGLRDFPFWCGGITVRINIKI